MQTKPKAHRSNLLSYAEVRNRVVFYVRIINEMFINLRHAVERGTLLGRLYENGPWCEKVMSGYLKPVDS